MKKITWFWCYAVIIVSQLTSVNGQFLYYKYFMAVNLLYFLCLVLCQGQTNITICFNNWLCFDQSNSHFFSSMFDNIVMPTSHYQVSLQFALITEGDMHIVLAYTRVVHMHWAMVQLWQNESNNTLWSLCMVGRYSMTKVLQFNYYMTVMITSYCVRGSMTSMHG